MNDYLAFRKMITPLVIQVVFWVGVVAVVIGALVSFGQSRVGEGLLMLILGPLVIRIYAELIILAFRIYDRMTEIARNTTPAGAAPPSPQQQQYNSPYGQ